MPTAVTSGVRVTVESTYLEEHSSPDENRYAFAYFITIANEGAPRVQLRRRHWIITDGNGKVEEVRGPGVVGEQPVLDPGDSYQYTSGCPLSTPTGFMVGIYTMRDADGALFDVRIPAFSLDLPDTGRTVN